MSDDHPFLDETLPLAALHRVDAACLKFEETLKDEGAPSIEEFLADAEGPERARLLYELLLLELEYHRQDDKPPAREKYLGRFPEDDARVVCYAFEQFDEGKARTKIRYIGNYELIEEIARGGMGVVYKARQVNLNRLVALKMILSGKLAGPHEIDRFRAEAEAAAHLQHPGIVAIHEIGEYEGHHYFSMDYVEGPSLAQLIRDTPLPPRTAADYVRQIAEAVQYAHDHGVLHRDLKPSNVLIDESGAVRVTDFGLAKRVESGSDLTGSEQILGTVAYMPPEQAGAKHEMIGPVSDVYSLGATLYHLLTGRPPFQAASVLDTLMQVMDKEPLRPTDLNSDVPRDLETICLKCLQKHVGKRYASAATLADDLGRYLNNEPIHARPVSRIERTIKWVRRRPAMATLLALFIVSMIAGTSVSSFFAIRANERANAEAEAKRLATQREGEALENEKKAEGLANKLTVALDHSQRRQSRISLMLAKRQYQEGNLGGARELLESCPQKYRAWEWYHIHRLCHPSLRAFVAHRSEVTCVKFHPQGKSVASSGRDGTIRIWNPTTGETLHMLRGHNGAVNDFTYTSDGARLISVGQDGTVKSWDTASGSLLATKMAHDGSANCVGVSADSKLVATGGSDKQAIVWSVDTWTEMRRHKHMDSLRSVVLSRDGRRFVSADIKGGGQLTDLLEGDFVMLQLKSHPRLCFRPDGKVLAVASTATILFFDASTGKELGRFEETDRWMFSIDWSRNAQKIVVGRSDGKIEVFRVHNYEAQAATQPTLSVHKLYSAHTGRIHTIAFSPDSERIVSGSDDKTVKVWPDPLPPVRTFPQIRRWAPRFSHENIANVSFHPLGACMASSLSENTIGVWSIPTGEMKRRVYGHEGSVHEVQFSPDGRLLASASTDCTVRLWATDSFVNHKVLRGHTDAVFAIAFSPDSRTLVSASKDARLLIWSVQDGRIEKTLTGHSGPIYSVDFSPDGKEIASAGADGKVIVWDSVTGVKKRTLQLNLTGTWRPAWHVSFSPDGTLLAAGYWGTVFVWKTSDGALLHKVRAHHGWVYGVAFSPDSRRLATASWDKTFKLLDAQTGEEVLLLGSHSADNAWARAVAFGPKGRFLATMTDESIQLWDSSPRDILSAGKAERRSENAHEIDALRWVISGRGHAQVACHDGEIREVKDVSEVPEGGFHCNGPPKLDH